jgi:hypothetical protein
MEGEAANMAAREGVIAPGVREPCVDNIRSFRYCEGDLRGDD